MRHNPYRSQSVSIPAGSGGRVLAAELTVPHFAQGLVVFAHDSGTRRDDPHDRLVAARLHESGIATLLVDPLDEHEARDYHNLFDEELIAERLMEAVRWLGSQPSTRSLALGYFGAGTGAAGALIAAARDPDRAGAVVSRGGRPDMALSWLHRVRAPTLFIVGEWDDKGLDWNKCAYRRMPGKKSLVLVPGATQLFAEAGTLDTAAAHAQRWFARYLGGASDTRLESSLEVNLGKSAASHIS